jgi:hypothetical protein
MRPAALSEEDEMMGIDLSEGEIPGEEAEVQEVPIPGQESEVPREAEKARDSDKDRRKAVKFSDEAATTVKRQKAPARKQSYKGLTSVFGAGDILLEHFANSKLDITVAQYIATSKESRDFLAKGLKD